MIAKSMLMCPQGLRPRARDATCLLPAMLLILKLYFCPPQMKIQTDSKIIC